MNAEILISFLVFTLLVAGVSWYRTKRQRLATATDYFLGNRSLGFVVIGGALFLTNVSGNQFIGENESVYTNNMTVMAWGMSSILAMLLVAEFFMPMYLKIGAVTTPDFLEKRYDPATKRIVSVVFLLSYLVNLIPTVLYGGAVAFNGMFHLSAVLGIGHWATIWLLAAAIGTIGCLYAILGGLKAITISDTVQGAGMLVAGLLLPYFGFRYLGHGSVLTGMHIVFRTDPAHLNAIGSAKDAVPFSTLFTGMLLVNLYYWGMEQFIVQQALASKSLADSQKGIALACLCKVASPLLLNVPGLIAVHMYSHLDNTAEVFPRLAGDVLPPVVAGFMAAIVFGASLSVYNAGLNSSATLFIMNIYKPWKEKRQVAVSDRQLLRTSRRFQVLVALAGICTAPFIMLFKGGFYTYIQMLSGFFGLPIFTLLAVGFVTKRVPPLAAKVGLVFFIVSYALTQLVFDTGLHYLHVMAILFVLTTLLMLAIGRVRPMEVPFSMPRGEAVVSLQPWKNRHWYSLVLLLLMVLMFVLFSPWGLAK